jgi:outer membrane biosynthesis protein TonB
VAKLIYAFLALAAASLVTGFLVRTSNVPLLVSIGMSGVIAVLILAGWSRRLRQGAFLDGDEADVEELDIVEVDEAELTSVVAGEPVVPSRPRARSRPARPQATGPHETIELPKTEPAAERRKKGAARRREPTSRRRPEPAAELAETRTIRRPKPTPARRPKPAPARRPKPAPAQGAKPTPAGRPKAAAAKAKRGPRVKVIPGRSRYHAAGCRFAKSDDAVEVTEATARRRGYVACTVCKP